MSTISHSAPAVHHAEARHVATAAKTPSEKHTDSHAKQTAQSKPADHVGKKVDIKA